MMITRDPARVLSSCLTMKLEVIIVLCGYLIISIIYSKMVTVADDPGYKYIKSLYGGNVESLYKQETGTLWSIILLRANQTNHFARLKKPLPM